LYGQATRKTELFKKLYSDSIWDQVLFCETAEKRLSPRQVAQALRELAEEFDRLVKVLEKHKFLTNADWYNGLSKRNAR